MNIGKIELDQESYERLVTIATREKRPIPWQAEWMLTRAIEQASRGDGGREAPVPATGQEQRHD